MPRAYAERAAEGIMEADGRCLYEVSRRVRFCCGFVVVQRAAAHQRTSICSHLITRAGPRRGQGCLAGAVRACYARASSSILLLTLSEDARPLMQADIKKAYRTLALRCHPDKCPGDEVRSASHACRALMCRPVHKLARSLPERCFAGRAQTAKASFQSLQRIYAVLGDPEKCGPTPATQVPPAALCQVLCARCQVQVPPAGAPLGPPALPYTATLPQPPSARAVGKSRQACAQHSL